MDEAPDWDDLMEDVMEQEPMPEDDDDDEYEQRMWAMMDDEEEPTPTAVAPNATNNNINTPATAPTSPTPSPNNDIDQAEDEEDLAELPVRPSPKKKDAFAFERYTSGTVWRSETVDSPQRATLKATEWRKKDRTTNEDSHKNHNGSQHTIRMSPETHLVRQYHRTAVTTKALLATPRYTVSRRRSTQHPLGAKTCTVTAADGQQVSWATKRATTQTVSSSTTNNVFATDASLQGVFDRVQARRRARPLSTTKTASTASSVSTNNHQRPAHKNHLWVNAHAPRSFAHLLSDDRTNRLVLQALRAWDPYVFGTPPPKATPSHADKRPEMNRRVLLLSGPPGVGKTTLAHICAAHAGYRPLEVNGSDDRSKDVLLDRVQRAMESTTLHSYAATHDQQKRKALPNCLILDEIDGADSGGAIQALVDIIKADLPTTKSGKTKVTYLRRPIIFICNNKYAPALRPLLPYAIHFAVEPPTPAKLVARLRSVLQAERCSLIAGSSLLHQLVAAGGGDIRYCLFALQCAATKAKRPELYTEEEGFADISAALAQSLRGGGGGGLKDTHSDVLSVMTSVFQKKKRSDTKNPGRRRSVSAAAVDKNKGASGDADYVQNLVTSYGDNSKLLDLLFLNAIRVSFIDPTFDRCATMYEWLSQADTYRSTTSVSAMANSSLQHAMQNLYIPATAGVLHWLCRVEQRQELTFTDRELVDLRFHKEANQELAFRIAEGITPACKSARTVSLMGVETASYVLWVLSAGYGKCALDRAVSSLHLLKDDEKQCFLHHADILRSLGLWYKADPMDFSHMKEQQELRLKLEPPLQRFTRYRHGYRSRRRPVPDMIKTLLVQAAQAKVPSTSESPFDALSSPSRSLLSPSGEKRKDSPTSVSDLVASSKKKAKLTTSKTTAVTHFLGLGAKQAKAALQARKMARVGVGSRNNKVAHTGSGVPLSQVMRLKYTKGFTQAVRVPCRLDDLA